MTRSRCALAVGLLAVLPALLANAPPPLDLHSRRHETTHEDWLVVVPSPNREARLLLPHDFLARHRTETSPGGSEPIGFSLPSILAGFTLAIGIGLAGLLLLRRASPRLLTGGLACVLAGLLFVNSSCSPSRDVRDNRDYHQGYRSANGVRVNSA